MRLNNNHGVDEDDARPSKPPSHATQVLQCYALNQIDPIFPSCFSISV